MTLIEAIQHVHQIPGERGRFLVPSRTTGQPQHLVDIDEYEGVGMCSCRDFACRHEPHLSGKEGAGYNPEARCWHIAVALEARHLIDVRERNGGQT